jgi:hypothetical protein
MAGTTRVTEGRFARCALVVITLAGVASVMTGCTSSDGCTSPETFVVYEPGAAVSAVPLCSNATTADASFGSLTIDGSFISFSPFPGSVTLSAAGFTQCEAICAGANATVPCCVSVWEPNTILCPPACVPTQ